MFAFTFQARAVLINAGQANAATVYFLRLLLLLILDNHYLISWSIETQIIGNILIAYFRNKLDVLGSQLQHFSTLLTELRSFLVTVDIYTVTIL